MGVDVDNSFRGTIIVNNDVVVVVIEIIFIAPAYMRVRNGSLLEEIGIVRNSVDAPDAFPFVIVLSSLRIAQDDPADGIAFVDLYAEVGALCQLVDGAVVRSAGGSAIAEVDFHPPLSESFYRLFLAYRIHGIA